MSLLAIRVARPTLELDRIRSFYEHLVRLPVLWSFTDHEGFDGVILGVPEPQAQLELVRSPHGDVPTPSAEDALVLYESTTAFDGLVSRLRRAGTVEVTGGPTVNPYWPRNGASVFVDPDGYRLVVAPASELGRALPPTAASFRVVPPGAEWCGTCPCSTWPTIRSRRCSAPTRPGRCSPSTGPTANPSGSSWQLTSSAVMWS